MYGWVDGAAVTGENWAIGGGGCGGGGGDIRLAMLDGYSGGTFTTCVGHADRNSGNAHGEWNLCIRSPGRKSANGDTGNAGAGSSETNALLGADEGF